MSLNQIKIGDRWETECEKTPRNRIGSHHVTITHISSDHIMGICEERRLTWDRFGNPIGKAHTFGRLDRPCICISLTFERKTTGSGIIFWGGKGANKMTEQDFIPGADIYLNPERQREAKEKEELVKLRDQFAMAALTGLLAYSNEYSSNPNTQCDIGSKHEIEPYVAKEYAVRSYSIADAMMEARK